MCRDVNVIHADSARVTTDLCTVAGSTYHNLLVTSGELLSLGVVDQDAGLAFGKLPILGPRIVVILVQRL